MHRAKPFFTLLPWATDYWVNSQFERILGRHRHFVKPENLSGTHILGRGSKSVSAKRMGPLVRIYFMGMLVTCQGKGNLRGRCSCHCVLALAGEDKSSGWTWWQNFRRILWRSESDGTKEEGPPSGPKNLAEKLRSASKPRIVLFLTCHGSAQRATIRSDAHPVCKSGSPSCFWKLRYASPHNAPKDRRSCGFQKGKFLKIDIPMFVYLFV